MTATLSADDRAVHDRDNRCRSIETITPPTSAARIDQPIPLALALVLYQSAAAHGVDKATADGAAQLHRRGRRRNPGSRPPARG
jgi:hypothetical protein